MLSPRLFAPAPLSLLLLFALHPGTPAHADSIALTRLESIAFGNLPGVHTDSLLIMKDGKTVYERYARGYGTQSKHLSWSMGKSIAGMIAAQAIRSGTLQLTDPVHQWIPEYTGTASVLDLFQMSSGIEFREEYSGVPVDSDATRMLYLDGVKAGFASYTAGLPLRKGVQPGSHFYYSSGDANLLMEVVRRSLKSQVHYDIFPWMSFFLPLGIHNVTFEQDSAGTFVGSSYIYMTTADYAKIGQLLANKGAWNGKKLIPEWYWTLMNTIAPGVTNALPLTMQTRAYSAQITTNHPITGRNLPSEYPDLAEDSLLMIGHQGQLVIASPSQNLVIVRMATDKGDPFNPHRQEFFAAIRNFLDADKGQKITAAGDTSPESYAQSKKPIVPHTGKTRYWDYLKVPHLIRALYAKELCSCIFVLNRTLEQCQDDLKQSIPILPFARVNHTRKTVKTSLNEVRHSKASFRGDRLGCTLEK